MDLKWTELAQNNTKLWTITGVKTSGSCPVGLLF
jgi:hypothetical protein